MKVIQSDWVSVDEFALCSAEYLIEISGLSAPEFEDLVDSNVIVPINEQSEPREFSMGSVAVVNRARRLRDDFELDCHGMVLAIALLYRIESLQHQLDAVHAGTLMVPVSPFHSTWGALHG